MSQAGAQLKVTEKSDDKDPNTKKHKITKCGAGEKKDGKESFIK